MPRRGWIALVVLLALALAWVATRGTQEPPADRPVAARRSTAPPPRSPLPTARPRTPTPRPAPAAAPEPGRPDVEPDEEQDLAEVTVRVSDPFGEEVRLSARECRGVDRDEPEHVSTHETVFRFRARTGPCALQAVRVDGALRAWSDTVGLDLEPGVAYDVPLHMPAERTGGLGIAYKPDEDGMRVTRVRTDTPAEAFGLREGDVIVEVDGVAASELSATEFQQVLAGPEGTDVRFLVDHGDGEGPQPYTLKRTFIPR